ncbi:MAG: ribosome silencing factor [Endomicrobium sp.]|jgi:ribosome-associated protein|nr:ribosome silencing factor [Endomicrobium sp.]
MAQIDFLKMAKKAAAIADDKKADDIIILDVRNLTEIANYFVIAAAQSAPQINAVCSEIEKAFKEEDIKILRREGVSSTSWRVLDYGGLVVHVMSRQSRELYNLEKLWSDAKIIKTKMPVIKIAKPEIVEKIESKFNENAQKSKEAAKKAIKAAKKKINKEKKAIQKEYSKKLNEAKKSAKKKVKKTLETAKTKIKTVKRTVKAVGKGIEAFSRTLIKKKKGPGGRQTRKA